MPKAKVGLYANINAKKKRIAAGSGEKMRKVGAKGAPTVKDLKQSGKTAKKKPFSFPEFLARVQAKKKTAPKKK